MEAAFLVVDKRPLPLLLLALFDPVIKQTPAIVEWQQNGAAGPWQISAQPLKLRDPVVQEQAEALARSLFDAILETAPAIPQWIQVGGQLHDIHATHTSVRTSGRPWVQGHRLLKAVAWPHSSRYVALDRFVLAVPCCEPGQLSLAVGNSGAIFAGGGLVSASSRLSQMSGLGQHGERAAMRAADRGACSGSHRSLARESKDMTDHR